MATVLWARVFPWSKEIALSALESGVETLWVPEGCGGKVRELGRVVTVCADEIDELDHAVERIRRDCVFQAAGFCFSVRLGQPQHAEREDHQCRLRRG